MPQTKEYFQEYWKKQKGLKSLIKTDLSRIEAQRRLNGIGIMNRSRRGEIYVAEKDLEMANEICSDNPIKQDKPANFLKSITNVFKLAKVEAEPLAKKFLHIQDTKQEEPVKKSRKRKPRKEPQGKPETNLTEKQVHLIKSHLFEAIALLENVQVNKDRTVCESCGRLFRMKSTRFVNGRRLCFFCSRQNVRLMPLFRINSPNRTEHPSPQTVNERELSEAKKELLPKILAEKIQQAQSQPQEQEENITLEPVKEKTKGEEK